MKGTSDPRKGIISRPALPIVTRKVQSAYIDTNVYGAAVEAGDRQPSSRETLQFAYQRVVVCVGSRLVRREIRRLEERLGLTLVLPLYERAVQIEAPASREAKGIQARYMSGAGLSYADALHLALASFQRADVFLSWNRGDIVKEKTLRSVARINSGLGIPTPAILTPQEFLRRAKFSAAGRCLILD